MQAYDIEFQRWVDAVQVGEATGDYTDGPARGTATPPRRSARPACESLETGQPVEVEMVARESITGA